MSKGQNKETNSNEETKLTLEEALVRVQELEAILKAKESEKLTLSEKLEQYEAKFTVETDAKSQAEKWYQKNTIKGRFMSIFILCKDTSSRVSIKTLSSVMDIILKVHDEVLKLNDDQTEVHFADQKVDVKDIETLDIFQGLARPYEVSEDFETYDAKRYTTKLIIDLGYDGKTKMPTLRDYKEALRLIKTCFKYFKENFIPMTTLRYSTSVSVAMKECAHRSTDGKFFISSRAVKESYFIPYYLPELNDCLAWKDQYYNEFASKYIDLYFNKFVVTSVRGNHN